ncbi:TPA: hypothetical protein ACJG4C_004891 [Salmonella enterica subsp. diarizonae serovar 61:r:z53]
MKLAMTNLITTLAAISTTLSGLSAPLPQQVTKRAIAAVICAGTNPVIDNPPENPSWVGSAFDGTVTIGTRLAELQRECNAQRLADTGMHQLERDDGCLGGGRGFVL